MMKKIRLLAVCGVLVFSLSACGNNKKSESGTGGIAIGTQLSGTIPSVNDDQNFFSGKNEAGSLSGITALLGTETSSQAWFPVELCNQIVALDLCIISKAPIENQPIMKAQLQKSLEPRKLLVETDLRQICQDIIDQESFQEVMKHYTGTGNACTF